MSNIVELHTTKDDIYIRGADNREFTMTRAQILAIYQTKTGNAASRRQQTIDDVLNAAQTALGEQQFSAIMTTLDFDPTDSNRQLLMTIRESLV